ncbi:Two-component system response regulator RacR [hydrothermal vent metagenome]|uniref:Two-component system response regulator RacR n=1 Tax=hydrothermal vent metagenome TaxID=652676 RepID=A0A1W1BID8_9ZZZZ
MIKILMIEDDVEFAEILSEYLAMFDMEVTNYDDPFLGLSAGIPKYDLIILDLTLPGMDGLEVCKEIADRYHIPIIISSARSDIQDKVTGLELGADDYIPKPYDPKEMLARIHALLRRYEENGSPKEPIKDLEIVQDVIFHNGKALNLTPAEFDILSQLIHHRGEALSREQLIYSSNSMSIDSHHKSLDMIISKLRNKLGDSQLIKSVRGVGFKLI